MSRTQKTIRLTCDLCGHAVDVPFPKLDQGPFVVPAGWGTGSWLRQLSPRGKEHLVLGCGVQPDFCPECMEAVAEALKARRAFREVSK